VKRFLTAQGFALAAVILAGLFTSSSALAETSGGAPVSQTGTSVHALGERANTWMLQNEYRKLCLTVTWNGSELKSYRCVDNSPDQLWRRWGTNIQSVHNGECLAVADNGKQIVTEPCADDATQKWRDAPGKALRNEASDGCLTAKFHDQSLITYPCKPGSEDQVWNKIRP
jgi:hypothetical protein